MEQTTINGLAAQIQAGSLKEVTASRVELKADWHQEHGKDLSALANTEGQESGWLVVGVDDNGKLKGHNEGWLKKIEQTIANHLLQYLSPHWAVTKTKGYSFDSGCCFILEVRCPGDIAEWNGRAYKLSSTSSKEMSPDESLALSMRLPGEDFSKSPWSGEINGSLILDFAKKLKTAEAGELPDDLSSISPQDVLRKLGIQDKRVADILFGSIPIRVIYYSENGDVIEQEEKHGAFEILSDTFISTVQTWTKKQGTVVRGNTTSVNTDHPYPPAVLREAFANSVAHALYQRGDGQIIVDLHPTRLTIRNNCMLEAKAFSKQWFSKDTYVKNKLLMRVLRIARIADELGSGKARIFRQMIEAGKREPLIEFSEHGKYGVWSVTIYNEEHNGHLLMLIDRLKKMFPLPDEARIATALVLWSDRTWSNILEKLDGHFQNIALRVIQSESSPVHVIGNDLFLKRWVEVALTGQESRRLNPAEELKVKTLLQRFAFQDQRNGYISSDEARQIIGLSNTQSEIVQLSNLFKRWSESKEIEMVKRGHWRFISDTERNTRVIMSLLAKTLNAKDD